jgi:hypothetical protein
MEREDQGLSWRKVQEKAITMPLIKTKRMMRKLRTFSLRVRETSRIESRSLRSANKFLLEAFMVRFTSRDIDRPEA